MAVDFDYMAYVRDFEEVNGRPPTSQEIEQAQSLVNRYTGAAASYQASPVDDVEDYEAGPMTKSAKLKLAGATGFYWLVKAVLLVIQTPFYLTRLFFNLIKCSLITIVVWCISKFVLMLLLLLVTDFIFGIDDKWTHVPQFIKNMFTLLYGNSMFTTDIPNFFPHPVFDAWLIGIVAVFLAFALTFSKFDD